MYGSVGCTCTCLSGGVHALGECCSFVPFISLLNGVAVFTDYVTMGGGGGDSKPDHVCISTYFIWDNV